MTKTLIVLLTTLIAVIAVFYIYYNIKTPGGVEQPTTVPSSIETTIATTTTIPQGAGESNFSITFKVQEPPEEVLNGE